MSRFAAWSRAIREQIVPTIVAVLVYVPLAYLWATGQPVSDAHIGLAGLIAGYYYSRATANGSAREAAAAAVGMTLARIGQPPPPAPEETT
ncbi:MAG TPA: hypothetical protein VNJ28_04655 [Candidatus Limnocylindrales bacterium]|nr:hypothetical protein [Candidatus Limnocylindrales bacterium]